MRHALLVFGFVATLAAQAPKPPSPPDAGLELFQRAEAGLAVLPEVDRPMVFEGVLALQLPVDKASALAGYHRLFQMALALPGKPNLFSFYTKEQAELGAIISLTDQHDLDAALELARTADVPRAKMYDFILARAAGHWTVQRGLDLVHECVQADGSYPYTGALRMAIAAKDDAITQRQLIRGIYTAASNQTDLIAFGLTGGFEALAQGHELAPDLDAELESSLTAIITRIGKDPRHINAVSGSRLFPLLEKISPDRAAELKAAYPELVAVPPRPRVYSNTVANGSYHATLIQPADEQVQDMAEKDPDGALKLASGQQDTLMYFRALAAVALALATSKPELARQAAAQAGALVPDDDALNNIPVALAAVKLAQAWEKLGDRASARSLMLRLLDVADHQAAQFADKYRAAPENANGLSGAALSTSKPALASQLCCSEPSWLAQQVYALAGSLDFTLARRRLDALPSDVLFPLTAATLAAQYYPVKN